MLLFFKKFSMDRQAPKKFATKLYRSTAREEIFSATKRGAKI